jgi:hypothetical protein
MPGIKLNLTASVIGHPQLGKNATGEDHDEHCKERCKCE